MSPDRAHVARLLMLTGTAIGGALGVLAVLIEALKVGLDLI